MEGVLEATTLATESLCGIGSDLLPFYRSTPLDECAGSEEDSIGRQMAAPTYASTQKIEKSSKRRGKRRKVDITNWRPDSDTINYHRRAREKGRLDTNRRSKFMMWCALRGYDPLDVISGKVGIN